jgi:gas vesicle protein
VKFFAGFVIGALVGAAAAMVIAPQTGDEMRDVLYARSRETTGRVCDAADDLAEAAKAFTSEVHASVAELIGRGRAIVDEARTEGRRAAEEQRESLQTQSNI